MKSIVYRLGKSFTPTATALLLCISFFAVNASAKAVVSQVSMDSLGSTSSTTGTEGYGNSFKWVGSGSLKAINIVPDATTGSSNVNLYIHSGDVACSVANQATAIYTNTAGTALSNKYSTYNSTKEFSTVATTPTALTGGNTYTFCFHDHAGTTTPAFGFSSTSTYADGDRNDELGGLLYDLTFELFDDTAPTITATSTATVGLTTLTFNATSDSYGTGYWVILPSASAAPSVAQVIAGQDSNGTAVTLSGSAIVKTATLKAFSITGLSAGTSYNIYYVVKDAGGTNSLVSTTAVTTLSPTVSSESVDLVSTTSVTYSAKSDTTGTGYWVVLPSAAAAPSAAQIVAGQDSFSAAVTLSGNAAITANTTKQFGITGLTASTNYKMYFVARALGGNSTVSTTSFTTSWFVPSSSVVINQVLKDGEKASTKPEGLGQTFTWNSTGKLSAIDIVPDTVGSSTYYDLYIFNGAVGCTSANITALAGANTIYSDTTGIAATHKYSTYSTDGSLQTITLTSPVAITSGNQYTFCFYDHNGTAFIDLGLGSQSTSPYAGGGSTNGSAGGGAISATSDLVFQLHAVIAAPAPVIVYTPPVDRTPPTVSALNISSITENSAVLTASINESGKGYWVVLPKTSNAPSNAQVQFGMDSAYQYVTTKGSSSMSSGSPVTFSITGLQAGGDYMLYFVAKDDMENMSVMSTLGLKTTTPDPFTVATVSGAKLATSYVSDEINVSGIKTSVTASISGGQLSINGGAFSDKNATVSAGDKIRIKLISSGELNTTKSATISVGGYVTDFQVKTIDLLKVVAFDSNISLTIDDSVELNSSRLLLKDDANGSITYTLVKAPITGVFSINSQTINVDTNFTQQDINDGRVIYTPTEEGNDSMVLNALGASGNILENIKFNMEINKSSLTPLFAIVTSESGVTDKKAKFVIRSEMDLNISYMLMPSDLEQLGNIPTGFYMYLTQSGRFEKKAGIDKVLRLDSLVQDADYVLSASVEPPYKYSKKVKIKTLPLLSDESKTQKLEFSAGWNMMSLPYRTVLGSGDMHTLFYENENVVSLYKFTGFGYLGYFTDKAHPYLAATQPTFETLSSKEGFWLNAKKSGSVSFEVTDSVLQDSLVIYGDEMADITTQWTFSGVNKTMSFKELHNHIKNKQGVDVELLYTYKNGNWLNYIPNTNDSNGGVLVTEKDAVWIKSK